MDRRSFCKTAGALGVVAGTAGCLGVLGDPGAEGAISAPRSRSQRGIVPELRRRDARVHRPRSDPQRGDLDSTVRGRARGAVDLFYTNCPDGVCPALILRLRRGQEAAAEAGYGDQVAFLPTTFDPERDTAETLREYAGQQGVDLDAGNWHFLRPETYERAQEIRRALRSEDREDTGRRYREPGVPLPALRAHHSRQQARDHRACVPTGTKDRHRTARRRPQTSRDRVRARGVW